jgi:hypothetical protein
MLVLTKERRQKFVQIVTTVRSLQARIGLEQLERVPAVCYKWDVSPQFDWMHRPQQRLVTHSNKNHSYIRIPTIQKCSNMNDKDLSIPLAYLASLPRVVGNSTRCTPVASLCSTLHRNSIRSPRHIQLGLPELQSMHLARTNNSRLLVCLVCLKTLLLVPSAYWTANGAGRGGLPCAIGAAMQVQPPRNTCIPHELRSLADQQNRLHKFDSSIKTRRCCL